MHLHIIFAHPSSTSFTAQVLDAFIHGLSEARHTFTICDCYRSHFTPCLDAVHYTRETMLHPDTPPPHDVLDEQRKVQSANALAFVYPVWWSDCPAIMKGWFDRVWTNGFAYSYENDVRASLINPKKALVLCTAGHSIEHLEATGIAQSMRCIMLNDRLNNVGIKNAEMIILDGTTEKKPQTITKHLKTAQTYGQTYFS